MKTLVRVDGDEAMGSLLRAGCNATPGITACCLDGSVRLFILAIWSVMDAICCRMS